MDETRQPTILHVEDDFVDAEILRRALKSRGIQANLHHVKDGEGALKLLRSAELTREQTERMVLFVDVNMPGMNGHQLLDQIRSDESLRPLIIFMLTTSDHNRDITKAYDKNVAGYFLKSELDALINTLTLYLDYATFPPVVLSSAV